MTAPNPLARALVRFGYWPSLLLLTAVLAMPSVYFAGRSAMAADLWNQTLKSLADAESTISQEDKQAELDRFSSRRDRNSTTALALLILPGAAFLAGAVLSIKVRRAARREDDADEG